MEVFAQAEQEAVERIEQTPEIQGDQNGTGIIPSRNWVKSLWNEVGIFRTEQGPQRRYCINNSAPDA